MLKKLNVKDLKEGMVTARDVHIPIPLLKEGKVIGVESAVDDDSLTLIPAGIVITKKIIELFKNHVEYVDVLVRSILVSLDETTITEDVTKNIKVNGKLRISAKISPFIKISATNKIIIESDIPAGCTIESETAEIVIKGNILGTKQAPVRLKAFNGISANSITSAELVSGGSAIILKNVIDSLIISKETITVTGCVIRSKLQTQESIKLHDCGSLKEKGLITLIISTDSYNNLNEKFSIEAQKTPILIDDLKKRATDISKFKDQIKELLKQGQKAPRDKKKFALEQLVTAEKDLKEAKYDFRLHRSSLVDISSQLIEQMLKNKIIISGALYPPVSVTIENFTIMMNKALERVTFYIHDTEKKLKYKEFTHL
jgi:uncharacterized protein (DUF342 family)